MTILCYLIAAVAIYFAVPGMVQMACGAIISLVTFRVLGAQLTMVIGAIASWCLLAALWHIAEGGIMPISILAGGFVFLFVHGWMSRDELTKQSEQMMAAEAWGIVIVAAILLYYSDPIRWF